MVPVTSRTRAVWRRTIALGWLIALDQRLATLRRTVDIVVTGLFSPVAVAAVGWGGWQAVAGRLIAERSDA